MATTKAFLSLEGDSLPADCITIRYEAHETLSRPYEVAVEFYSEDTSFDVKNCLRKAFLLTIVNEREERRHLHGIVETAEFYRAAGPRLHFRVTLRPALAALGYREDSRIFQNNSIVDVITTIFTEAGFDDKVEWQLTVAHEPREYIVQYRESTLNFVHRLLEDAGIFYFFKHTPQGHVLIVGDDPKTSFVPMDDAVEVHLSLSQGSAILTTESAREFSATRALRTTHAKLRDYDFEKPSLRPEGEQPCDDAFPMDYYEYPGGFTKSADGKARANARIRELRRDADTCTGASSAIGMRCGVPFYVEGAAEECLNGGFVVTSLISTGAQNPEQTDNHACQNHFRGIPAGASYAPPRHAVKPRIHGIQTAIVTGPTTDEQAIHTEKYGRIKVRFYWDRVNQQNDTSSMWIRVAQAAMGGSMILPRVGWEVSVCFLDGDPDRPLVLGRVYNAEKTPPYALPGAQASGSMKSMSTPGAGGFNEFKMNDSGGSQGYGISAQKDLNVKTGNNKSVKVAVDETHSVNTNMTTSVGASETLKVGGNQTIDIGAVLSHSIGGSQNITISGNDTSNATSNYVEKIGGKRAYTISGRQMVLQNAIKCTVKGDFTRKVGAVHLNASVASIEDNILGDYNSTVGLASADLINGTHSESVTGNKTETSLAAELHLLKGGLNQSAQAVKNMVGGLHYQKLDGNLTLKAPQLVLLGAFGIFKGGDSTVKLGGGPIVLKGSTVAVETAMLIRLAGQMKMGAG